MFLSLGVYWAAFGWKFALGLVISIYVHEMGQRRSVLRGGSAFRATAPMFIPGVGRGRAALQQNPANPVENSRIGLAGPLLGGWERPSRLCAFT